MKYRYYKIGAAVIAGLLLMVCGLPSYAVSLEFVGLSSADEHNYVGRVRIPIDDPNNSDPGPAVDVGATDFTIEFWMRTTVAGPSISCNSNSWINARIIIDRDRYNQGRAYGIAIADGSIAFGVDSASSSETVCGDTNVADDTWHHIAVQRRFSDGRLYIYVDGALDEDEDGPDGDVSYPNDGYPESFCGPSSNQACLESDPYIVIGAEKHDADVDTYPPYIGKIDELRFSNNLRYSTSGYSVPMNDFPDTDANTVGMYHFNEGSAGSNCATNTSIFDSATASTGHCRFGGTPQAGPIWSGDTPFSPTSGSSSSSSGGGSSSSSSSSSSSGGDSGGGGGGGQLGVWILGLLMSAYGRRLYLQSKK